ncbi:MAG: metallophosphoesterase [bacterium]
MKTLIVSDVHLYHVFDEKKFLFLKGLFSSVDTIILNGDFWDGYRTTFDAFVSSDWKQLFPLLREKNTIYLYGNHNQRLFSDERVFLFSSVQKNSHLLTMGPQTYHIEHGHFLQKSIDLIYPFSKKSLYYINNVMQRLEHLLDIVGNPHHIFLKKENETIKKKLRAIQFPHWYVCGHTHYAEIDTNNKFANSGFIQFGKASYLIIDSSGLSLHTKKY